MIFSKSYNFSEIFRKILMESWRCLSMSIRLDSDPRLFPMARFLGIFWWVFLRFVRVVESENISSLQIFGRFWWWTSWMSGKIFWGTKNLEPKWALFCLVMEAHHLHSLGAIHTPEGVVLPSCILFSPPRKSMVIQSPPQKNWWKSKLLGCFFFKGASKGHVFPWKFNSEFAPENRPKLPKRKVEKDREAKALLDL